MTNIGDSVQTGDLSLPLGTEIESMGRHYIREVDGWHSVTPGCHYNRPSTWRVTGTVTAMTPYAETLAMHKQRFAVTCLAMGYASGGGGYSDGARSIVRNLDLIDPRNEPLRIGSWVAAPVNLSMALVGTVLLSGATDRATGHTLYHVERPGRLGLLSGSRRTPEQLLLQVVALPHADVPWPEPGENEDDLIREFRVRCWDVGYTEKQNRSWCGDFEAAISVLSLSHVERERLAGGAGTVPAMGDVCTAALMGAAPVGTIVTEGPGSFTATKTNNGWQSWTGGHFDHESLYFHPGLRFHSIGVVAGPRYTRGTPVNTEQQNACAVGAVFAYRTGGTRYLWGRADGGQYPTVGITLDSTVVCRGNNDVTVVWDGVSPIHESGVFDRLELSAMPLGTIIGQGQWEGTRFGLMWEKVRSGGPIGSWRVIRDGEPLADEVTGLGITPLRYVYIPIPEVPRPETLPVSVLNDEF